MEIDLQYKIKNTRNYYKYLKENSWWFKDLNRDKNNFTKFNEYIKNKYELKVTDKLSNMIDNIDLISTLLNTIK